MNLLQTAKFYRDNGLSVIGSSVKGSILKWGKFQKEKPTDEELEYMFVKRGFNKIVLVCGEVSGNLEVIDVDVKHDLSGTMYQRLWDQIVDYYKGQPPFAMVKTPSGGVHLYYRCEVIGKCPPIARRSEMIDGKPKHFALIDMRANGGLIMMPPTEGYTFMDDKIPHNIPVISPDEREDILAICRQFNEVFEEEKPIVTRSAITYKKTPWGEYNDVEKWRDVLIESGWTKTSANETWEKWRKPGDDSGHHATWNTELRMFYVFSTSTLFEPNRGYRPFDIYKILKCDGDFRKALMEVKEQGFGLPFSPQEEGFIQRVTGEFNNGFSLDDIFEMLKPDFETEFRNVRDVSFNQLVEAAESRHEAANEVFWVEDDKGNFHLDKAALGDYLAKRGYRLLVDHEEAEKFRLVRIDFEKHLIQYIALDQFRKNLEATLYEVSHMASIRKLRNLVRGINDATLRTAFDFLPRIPYNEITFLKKGGSEFVQWFSFRNGAVKVTADNIEVIPYEDLPAGMLVWKKDIKKFDYEISDIETEEEFNESVVWLFFKRISGITPDLQHLDHQTELGETHPELASRFFAMLTTVGYTLSTYKNTDEPLAPILEEDIESSNNGGGTGKGLLMTIIGFLRNVVSLDCRNWTPAKSFPYQKVKLDTDIVHFEDYDPSKFKIGDLNNFITSGVDVENKFEGEFQIPYEMSPKAVISTNFKTSDDADFEARRQKKVYLARYFSRNHRPAQEFGKQFGRGSKWTDTDQQMSYNILFYCLQMYLKNGIIDFAPTVNVLRKSIIEDFGQEFLDFMDNFIIEFKGKWVLRKEAYENFLKEGTDKKYFSTRRFERGLKAYASKTNLKVNIVRNKKEAIGERDQFYFIFIDENAFDVPFEAKFIKDAFF